MKVGDYVRTKWGDIERIVRIDNDNIIVDIEEDEDGREYSKMCYKDDIIKSRPNIKDLIEAGDYVNGHRVCDSSYGLIIVAPTTDIWEMNSIKDEFKNNDLFVEKIYKLEDIEIKSIITKEQFESMEYKVGGK